DDPDAVGHAGLSFAGHDISLSETVLPGGISAARQNPSNHVSVARLLDHLDGLDLVADPDVVVLAQADAGLEGRLDLGDVVLEATQRLDRQAVGEHDAVADDASLRVAGDDTAAHVNTGDVAEL